MCLTKYAAFHKALHFVTLSGISKNKSWSETLMEDTGLGWPIDHLLYCTTLLSLLYYFFVYVVVWISILLHKSVSHACDTVTGDVCVMSDKCQMSPPPTPTPPLPEQKLPFSKTISNEPSAAAARLITVSFFHLFGINGGRIQFYIPLRPLISRLTSRNLGVINIRIHVSQTRTFSN